ncbi:hypothetical protein BpHYR1_045968 [Brachionus plicatilis]|uniref:Uncharacterized protein n=1 Tax=Brachionus plicatilis TaxID=10195 RepID=A0A3M7T6U1_BRAPC|nr:hypothetical protein BpHYR1_045968 [Brachionus plicatilis]
MGSTSPKSFPVNLSFTRFKTIIAFLFVSSTSILLIGLADPEVEAFCATGLLLAASTRRQ